MRVLNRTEHDAVGGGTDEYPGSGVAWPDRAEAERQIEALLEFVEMYNKRVSQSVTRG